MRVAPDRFEDALTAIAEENRSVYLFSIDGDDVHFDDKGLPIGDEDPSYGLFTAFHARGMAYGRFLAQSLKAFGLRGRALLAIDLGDLREFRSSMPVFAFQRRRFEAVPLLPDVEMLLYDFYVGEHFQDAHSFADKKAEAIFIGSTTGDPILTRHHVENGLNARLRAAAYFRDKTGVTFDLPNIVQHDSNETRSLVAQMNIGGRLRSWTEQTSFRYLISIDGNGAACSRPYLALAGQSVLLKYNSPHELYYFKGLRPWIEFIPIRTERDIVEVVASDRTEEALHADIASRSRQFARRNLSRIHAMRYTAELLQRYMMQFGAELNRSPADGLDTRFVVDAYAHLANVGTVWSEPAGWAGQDQAPIEAFALVTGEQILPEELAYAGIGADGTIVSPTDEDPLCGSCGAATPLHGMIVELTGTARRRYRLHYQARFADGHDSGLVRSGTRLYRRQAPLVAFRIVTSPR